MLRMITFDADGTLYAVRPAFPRSARASASSYLCRTTALRAAGSPAS